MAPSEPRPERTRRLWVLMQRIERARHRADLAQARTADGSTDYRAEMAEIAQEWKDLARHIEREQGGAASDPPDRPPESPGWPRRWRAGFFALGAASGALAALGAVTPHWIEAIGHVDPDRGSGALEWVVAAMVPLAGLTAAVSIYRRRRDAGG